MAVDASVLTFAVVAAVEVNIMTCERKYFGRQRERVQPAIAAFHETAGASPVSMVAQSSPPHQPIFLPHYYRLLHCLLRRADAGGDDAGDQEEAGEHHAAAAAGGSK